ncbi:MAG: putative endonuclease [Parcubacteria group bacterium Gr01-1014_18]|nr:MAG: putative endonuclease [Parcubacteria group bacterium Greene0416_36]TSC80216.1 MAG: putative endonuclease [Parcubacteria group bacterium Gr01-1014_18]TSC98398.1 MAG: putative endonuclease [Parcubacteria group bacterium Greene1014_20]TSD06939.1 MAG: putative endonuclease [Parcubacteria group bacterium Greene0714_2]
MNTSDKGTIAENLVSDYLESEGYSIRERNCSYRLGEIDIVAQKDETLSFVEVKLRLDADDGRFDALESFGWSKQKKFIKSVNNYLGRARNLNNPYQIDLVILYREAGRLFLEHFKNFEVKKSLEKYLVA